MGRHGAFLQALLAIFCIKPAVFLDTTCGDGKYLDEKYNTCITCTRCPNNQIVRIPCSLTADTTCGPFSEFQSFKQDSTRAVVTGEHETTRVTVKHKQPQDPEHANVTWYTVTMVLVAALSVTGAFLIGLALMTCYIMRKRRKESLLLPEREHAIKSETSTSKIERFEVVEET